MSCGLRGTLASQAPRHKGEQVGWGISHVPLPCRRGFTSMLQTHATCHQPDSKIQPSHTHADRHEQAHALLSPSYTHVRCHFSRHVVADSADRLSQSGRYMFQRTSLSVSVVADSADRLSQTGRYMFQRTSLSVSVVADSADRLSQAGCYMFQRTPLSVSEMQGALSVS